MCVVLLWLLLVALFLNFTPTRSTRALHINLERGQPKDILTIDVHFDGSATHPLPIQPLEILFNNQQSIATLYLNLKQQARSIEH